MGGEQRQREHNKLRYHQSREGARWMEEEGIIRGSERIRKKETFKLNNSYMCECGFEDFSEDDINLTAGLKEIINPPLHCSGWHHTSSNNMQHKPECHPSVQLSENPLNL